MIGQVGEPTNESLINRFKYHPPKNEETARAHENVRTVCWTTAETINAIVPDGREKALALTKIEEAMMWANAGIARNS